MSAHKHIDIICIAATVFAVVLTLLIVCGSALGLLPAMNAEANSGFFTANDLNADWDTSSATTIMLSDNGSSISGNGAYVNNGDVYIVYAGYYVLTGSLTDGSVIVDADKSDKIWISLNGVAIHCDDGAAIRIERADKAFLTLADGTENMVSSGAQYSAEIIASGVDGTIYSRDDLTINGTGSLAVNSTYRHGIVCNDNLVVAGGNITINAAQDGIHANDSVRIRDAALSITAGDDGITVSNDSETSFLYVESGEISIPACYEGLEAIDITIAGGTIDIRPTDDGINANGRGKTSVIRIAGGDITITNPSGRDADGLDSNGSIYIEGGRVFISVADSGGNYALDYGSENGGECLVSGGTVIVCGGSAMAEGFDQNSPQGFLMYSTSASAGTTIRLMDAFGTELLSEEIPCSFSSVVISTPEMKLGDVCTIEVGDVQEQVAIDNSSTSGFRPAGMFGGGGRFGGGGIWNDGNRDEMTDGQENHDNQPFGGRNKHPEDAPEDMPQDIPEGMPENMPQGIPGDLPQDIPPQTGGIPENDSNAFPHHPGFSGDSGSSGDSGFPEGMEPPDKIDRPDGQKQAGEQEWGTFAGRTPEADAGQIRGNGKGIFSPQQDENQMQSGSDISSNSSADTLGLLGISMLVLLLGLGIASKIKF